MSLQVTEFHRAFNLPISATPLLPSAEVRRLRQNLLQEELDEFLVAYVADDRIEMADGLADMCYIIGGTHVVYGIAASEPSETEFVGSMELDGVLYADMAAYLVAEQQNDLGGIGSSLNQMVVDIFRIATDLHIPLDKVFEEVHRSNMSKLMPDGSVRYREDGKVLKPQNWQPPQIAELLADVDIQAG